MKQSKHGPYPKVTPKVISDIKDVIIGKSDINDAFDKFCISYDHNIRHSESNWIKSRHILGKTKGETYYSKLAKTYDDNSERLIANFHIKLKELEKEKMVTITVAKTLSPILKK
jgi:hypothetical protein